MTHTWAACWVAKHCVVIQRLGSRGRASTANKTSSPTRNSGQSTPNIRLLDSRCLRNWGMVPHCAAFCAGRLCCRGGGGWHKASVSDWGGGGMPPGCVAVCSWRRLLASHHLLCPSLEPFPSVGGGAHRPLTTMCPPSPCLAYPYLPTPPSSPLGGCANGAPGLSLFHCPVSGPHRGGQLPSPLARCAQMDTPCRWWGGREGGGGGGLLLTGCTDGEGIPSGAQPAAKLPSPSP